MLLHFPSCPALAIAPVEEADTEEVDDATIVLVIAPAEGADAALTFVPAVEAATVLAATVHSIVPAKEAASSHFILLSEVSVTVLADTASVLALASAQNTDPLIALSSVLEPAHELLITPCYCSAQHHACGGGFH